MVDLHLHSTCSDGTDTPARLARLAAEAGLTAAVLTDHDGTDGTSAFLAAALDAGIRSTTGMEISADVPGRTVHLLAYGFNPADPALSAALARVRDGRRRRNAEILAKLSRAGCPLSLSEVVAEAGSPDLIARPHFARALVRKGYAHDRSDAFRRYLGRGARAYAERYRLAPREAIELVRGAGGAVSLAHPSSTQFDRAELRDFVARLADWGLAGIEVFYTGHLPGQIEEYLSLVREFGLVATGGSDYHGENKPAVRIGVAYGGLKVPDEAFDAILARCDRPAAAEKP